MLRCSKSIISQREVGKDTGSFSKALKSALDKKSTNPKVIIANTTKGFGVSFMENNVLWHYRSPQGQEYKDAMLELDNNEK